MQLVAIILIIWQAHHSNLLVSFLQVISLVADIKRLRIKYLCGYLKIPLPSAWLFWLLKCPQDNEPKSTWLFAWSVSISPTDKIIIIIIKNYIISFISIISMRASFLKLLLCSAHIAPNTDSWAIFGTCLSFCLSVFAFVSVFVITACIQMFCLVGLGCAHIAPDTDSWAADQFSDIWPAWENFEIGCFLLELF